MGVFGAPHIDRMDYPFPPSDGSENNPDVNLMSYKGVLGAHHIDRMDCPFPPSYGSEHSHDSQQNTQ